LGKNIRGHIVVAESKERAVHAHVERDISVQGTVVEVKVGAQIDIRGLDRSREHEHAGEHGCDLNNSEGEHCRVAFLSGMNPARNAGKGAAFIFLGQQEPRVRRQRE
jgi:hypothetical protein